MRSHEVATLVLRSKAICDLVKDVNRPAESRMGLSVVTSLESDLAETVGQPPACLNYTGVVSPSESVNDLCLEFSVIEPLLQDDLRYSAGAVKFDDQCPTTGGCIRESAKSRQPSRRVLDFASQQMQFDLDPRQVLPILSSK